MKPLKLLSLSALAAALTQPLAAEDFPLANDDFDDGDPATNNEGGFVLRNATSMDAIEENGALSFGPNKAWNWAAYALHTGSSFAPPEEGESYTIEWVFEPMSVIAHNDTEEAPAPVWGDLRHELSIAPVTHVKGDQVELWTTSDKGILTFQLTLKETDPALPTQLANVSVYAKDSNATTQSNGEWIMGTNDIDVSTSTKVTMVLTRDRLVISIDDIEIGKRELSDPGLAFDLGFDEGEEYEGGFFVSTMNQMVDRSTGTMGIESFSVTQTTNASPYAWPGGESYLSDLSALGINWELSGWTQVDTPIPVIQMTQNTSNSGGSNWPQGPRIGDSAPFDDTRGFWYDPNTDTTLDTRPETDAEATFNTPLTPILPPQNISDINPNISGKWLQTLGSTTHNGAMSLRFDNLPIHTGIDIDFLLAAMDSMDEPDWIGNTEGLEEPDPSGNGYNFRIKVDDTTVYETRFETGGILSNGLPEGVVDLGTGLNYSSNYSENWGPDQSGQTPTGPDDRSYYSWTTDSLYDYNALFNDSDRVIPHTGSELVITFEHGMDSGYTAGSSDEGLAIDAFALHLIGVRPGINSLRITDIASTPGGIQLTWTGGQSDSYYVYRSLDLVEWEELSDDETGPTFLDNDPPAGGRAYYRVQSE